MGRTGPTGATGSVFNLKYAYLILDNPPSTGTNFIFSFKSDPIEDPLTYNNHVTLTGSTITIPTIGVYRIHFKLQANSVSYIAGGIYVVDKYCAFAYSKGTGGFTTFLTTTQANSLVQFSGTYTTISVSGENCLIIQKLN
jgi:hypothetical protein